MSTRWQKRTSRQSAHRPRTRPAQATSIRISCARQAMSTRDGGRTVVVQSQGSQNSHRRRRCCSRTCRATRLAETRWNARSTLAIPLGPDLLIVSSCSATRGGRRTNHARMEDDLWDRESLVAHLQQLLLLDHDRGLGFGLALALNVQYRHHRGRRRQSRRGRSESRRRWSHVAQLVCRRGNKIGQHIRLHDRVVGTPTVAGSAYAKGQGSRAYFATSQSSAHWFDT